MNVPDIQNLVAFWRDAWRLRNMPRVAVNLQAHAAADNAPFYRDMVREYYAYTQRRHAKFPLIRHDQYGVALLKLPRSFDEYFAAVESSARRNYKKAARLGYEFRPIEHNAFLADIADIWRSTDARQGRLPQYIVEGRVTPTQHPPSRTRVHDYAYYGVLKDGRLRAYAGCMISGELCAIEQIYGHAGYQGDGIVPMLIMRMAGAMIESYPGVKVCTYDTLLGAGETLRRFKQKLGFIPHRVDWILGESVDSAGGGRDGAHTC